MRKISANYIFSGSGNFLKNGIIILNEDGYITEVIDTEGNLRESANLEFYNGILVPGFVNAHCHLELSHMKGIIPEKTGLPEFIRRISQLRNSPTKEILKSAMEAHDEMVRNGIVAVGDIANTSVSFEIKQNTDILYHSFIEVFSSNPDMAEKKIQEALGLTKMIQDKYQHRYSIIPHAPYSVSTYLLQFILKANPSDILTFHNQESASENLLFESGEGPLFEMLETLNSQYKYLKPPGLNPLLSIISQLKNPRKILPVHNTYTREKDLQSIQELNMDIFWILCPGSNLYIENKLPDIPLLTGGKNTIALGTDSLASNHQLSILEEMKLISFHYPKITLAELITWGTVNGAKALNMETKIGSLEPGKKPGINLIHEANLEKLELTGRCWVEKLA